MTGNALITNATATGIVPLRARAVRVEKARNSSDLGGEIPRRTDAGRGRDVQFSPRNLSQSGTSEYAPLWHGPLLNAAFVAQVLGQRLDADRDVRSVFAAYEEVAAQVAAPLFERNV